MQTRYEADTNVSLLEGCSHYVLPRIRNCFDCYSENMHDDFFKQQFQTLTISKQFTCKQPQTKSYPLNYSAEFSAYLLSIRACSK
jgi:hypothetical protein